MPADIRIKKGNLLKNHPIFGSSTYWPDIYLRSILQSGFWYLQCNNDVFSILSNLKHTPINDSRRFVNLEQSFLNQLDNNFEIFEGQNKLSLQEKMKLSSDVLLSCHPDKIALELTEEGSIFYTIIKNEIKIYFQHFLVDEFDDSDEAIVSVFKEGENLLNYGGSLDETISRLQLAVSTYSIIFPQFA